MLLIFTFLFNLQAVSHTKISSTFGMVSKKHIIIQQRTNMSHIYAIIDILWIYWISFEVHMPEKYICLFSVIIHEIYTLLCRVSSVQSILFVLIEYFNKNNNEPLIDKAIKNVKNRQRTFRKKLIIYFFSWYNPFMLLTLILFNHYYFEVSKRTSSLLALSPIGEQC